MDGAYAMAHKREVSQAKKNALDKARGKVKIKLKVKIKGDSDKFAPQDLRGLIPKK